MHVEDIHKQRKLCWSRYAIFFL